MLITIYNIYIDSLIFIRKNFLIVIPYTFLYILQLLLQMWLPRDSSMDDFISLLLLCFAEMCIVIIVYKREEIIVTEEPILKTFNRNSGHVLLLTAFFAFIIIGSILILAIFAVFFTKIVWLADLIYLPITLFLFAIYPFSLRHMIFYNINTVGDSIKAGSKELFKNFFFYFLVVLVGVLLSMFPSLFLPTRRFVFPLLPVAELSNFGSGVELLLGIVLSTLTSVALTYAFILKNKKFKHDS